MGLRQRKEGRRRSSWKSRRCPIVVNCSSPTAAPRGCARWDVRLNTRRRGSESAPRTYPNRRTGTVGWVDWTSARIPPGLPRIRSRWMSGLLSRLTYTWHRYRGFDLLALSRTMLGPELAIAAGGRQAPQQRLNLRPLRQGHGSLRPTFAAFVTGPLVSMCPPANVSHPPGRIHSASSRRGLPVPLATGLTGQELQILLVDLLYAARATERHGGRARRL